MRSIIVEDPEPVEESGGLDDFLACEIAQTGRLGGGAKQFGGLEALVEVRIAGGRHDIENGLGGLAQSIGAGGLKVRLVFGFLVVRTNLLWSLS